jgi:hypothetical protein
VHGTKDEFVAALEPGSLDWSATMIADHKAGLAHPEERFRRFVAPGSPFSPGHPLCPAVAAAMQPRFAPVLHARVSATIQFIHAKRNCLCFCE